MLFFQWHAEDWKGRVLWGVFPCLLGRSMDKEDSGPIRLLAADIDSRKRWILNKRFIISIQSSICGTGFPFCHWTLVLWRRLLYFWYLADVGAGRGIPERNETLIFRVSLVAIASMKRIGCTVKCLWPHAGAKNKNDIQRVGQAQRSFSNQFPLNILASSLTLGLLL